ncbi:MAG: hypothetical protein ACOCRN_00970 [Spirochaetia bacterium]
MSEQAKFSQELTDFLFESAEEVTMSFAGAESIPMNLSIPYFESVVYLRARIRVLLPYFQISSDLVSEVDSSVHSRLQQEFRTVSQDVLSFHYMLSSEAYENLDQTPFTEAWYHQVFDLFAGKMAAAMRRSKMYIWNLDRPDESEPDMSDEDALEYVHRAEIHHVVPFQRLVINFFNYQTE